MHDKLLAIQSELKVPKGQRNTFGNYNYRSCEDIVEAVKPLCAKHQCSLTLSDEIMNVAGRVYVKATATLQILETGELDSEYSQSGLTIQIVKPKSISATGWAREAETKKGMDDAQITGAASSYARKYALNGLFAIDDTKDADATNKHDEEAPPSSEEELEEELINL